MTMPICPLCRNQDNAGCFSERGYKLLFCFSCKLFFIDPYPTNRNYIHSRVSNYSYDEIEILDSSKKYLSEIELYKSLFPLIYEECKNAKSILDVGCGTGRLLELLGMKRDLFRVGIELNTDRAAMARKAAGCEIYQVPIESFKPCTKFDVITMINVLSHIPSFDDLFISINSLLHKDSKLILKVGEMSKDVKKDCVFDWEIPDHLHFLGLNTIDFICEKYGFIVCKHDRIPRSNELFSINRWKAPGRSVTRNMIKRMVVQMPLALPYLAKIYKLIYGEKVYSSFIVLSPK